jgi:hypothetical protein
LNAAGNGARARGLTQAPVSGGLANGGARPERSATRRVARPSGTTTGPGCLAPGDGERKALRGSAGRGKDLKDADTGTRDRLSSNEASGIGDPVSPCPLQLLFSYVLACGGDDARVCAKHIRGAAPAPRQASKLTPALRMACSSPRQAAERTSEQPLTREDK